MEDAATWLDSLGLTRPTLVLDEARARRNIARMAQKVAAAGARFRPHFKTHQSAQIGEWFREAGVDAITVSSVDMAWYFAAHGWRDITVAFPVNLLDVERIRRLAKRVTLHLVVDSAGVAGRLAASLADPVKVWIKIDGGYGRAGVNWKDSSGVMQVAAAIAQAPRLELTGLLAHSGHAYHAEGPDEIRRIHHTAVQRLAAMRDQLTRAGHAACEISLGDTPSCSVVDDLTGVDELRPGCFVFYDLMQWRLSACAPEQIAVAVACPVVGVQEDRGRVVLHGGAVHLGTESMGGPIGDRVFGYPAVPGKDGWAGPDAAHPVVGVSQEHGLVRADEELQARTAPGDLMLILPVHSCLTCNLFPEYVTTTGERIGRLRSNDSTEIGLRGDPEGREHARQ